MSSMRVLRFCSIVVGGNKPRFVHASTIESQTLSIVSRKQLTLDAADVMAQAAINEARSRDFKDISVAVMDATGRELVAKTQPGCPLLVPHLAKAKAGAAIGTHSNARALKDKYLPDRLAQLLSMTTVGEQHGVPFIAVPGGVLCRDAFGDIIAAIGVSGASADEDEHCAIIGGKAMGFQTEPAESVLR
mmetsp:Transcript_37612/g.62281  ORF Transcript_37612/g.62281 Transcript_37612/m.62281 type:complete len:189 (-) Transcript_37612:121-687(-)|eukprot:CAMPEP_0119329234 /NCGR_PEP_ID=MMETSP1333-20130426/75392_1 /TAXON_ID=418940 /ORGANISM="Scyphosphaera apsteinii, Strain RCC1455" /LENGTH=188 /DNA_ID=CAMNT_0007338303 /DNA_START=24 /DNA_END=590 /DNA_ORIENTATION=+